MDLEEMRPRLLRHIRDNLRHAVEVFLIDHEIDVGVEFFREGLVSGENAIGLAPGG